jgi:hypothetical protein
MSGHWPPEWEDQDEEFPEEADQLNADAEARLSEVTAYLASLLAPVLPANVEARISSALAAEAATRAGAATGGADAAQADDASAAGSQDGSTAGPSGSRTLTHPQGRVGAERHRGRLRVSRPLIAVGSLVVCLLLVGLGFGLSRSASEPTFSSADSGAANAPAAAPSAAASAASGFAGTASAFVVTESGTTYQSATLAAQVRDRLAASNGAPVERPEPTSPRNAGSSSAASGPTSTPTLVLRGCVSHLTGGQTPRLVDRATYQGEPAYIIATSSRVWVTGLGCTAAKPEVIVSVPLAR